MLCSYCERVASFEAIEYALERLEVVDVSTDAVHKIRRVDQDCQKPGEQGILKRPSDRKQLVVLARIEYAHISEKSH